MPDDPGLAERKVDGLRLVIARAEAAHLPALHALPAQHQHRHARRLGRTGAGQGIEQVAQGARLVEPPHAVEQAAHAGECLFALADARGRHGGLLALLGAVGGIGQRQRARVAFLFHGGVEPLLGLGVDDGPDFGGGALPIFFTRGGHHFIDRGADARFGLGHGAIAFGVRAGERVGPRGLQGPVVYGLEFGDRVAQLGLEARTQVMEGGVERLTDPVFQHFALDRGQRNGVRSDPRGWETRACQPMEPGH